MQLQRVFKIIVLRASKSLGKQVISYIPDKSINRCTTEEKLTI